MIFSNDILSKSVPTSDNAEACIHLSREMFGTLDELDNKLNQIIKFHENALQASGGFVGEKDRVAIIEKLNGIKNKVHDKLTTLLQLMEQYGLTSSKTAVENKILTVGAGATTQSRNYENIEN